MTAKHLMYEINRIRRRDIYGEATARDFLRMNRLWRRYAAILMSEAR